LPRRKLHRADIARELLRHLKPDFKTIADFRREQDMRACQYQAAGSWLSKPGLHSISMAELA
jgi:hypothetical protein